MKTLFSKMVVAGLALALSSICLMGCNTYPTVKIGNQIWMAKNMNVAVEGSMCYDNDPANCEKYGRLYTWEAAKKVCPSGWHLPSMEEFETLLENGQDKYGFSALPAGYYNGFFKNFDNLGDVAYFWSSTYYNDYRAYSLGISDLTARVRDYNKDDGNSVRCLKDN